MGFRMSILPAEAFFADMVFLVEGPSEVLFYHELARRLDVDLDYHNVSILSVEGVDFSVYVKILDAMHIPWAVRTDNDVSKVPRSDPEKWRLVGLNRALKLINGNEYEDLDEKPSSTDLTSEWSETSDEVNDHGVFVSKGDLETDLVTALEAPCLEFTAAENAQDAIKFFQKRKAVLMGEFVATHGEQLRTLGDDELARPLMYCVQQLRVNYDLGNHAN